MNCVFTGSAGTRMRVGFAAFYDSNTQHKLATHQAPHDSSNLSSLLQEPSRVCLLPMEQNQLPIELVPSKFHNCALERFSEINQALKLCRIQIRPAAVFAIDRGAVDTVAIDNWGLCISAQSCH